MYKLLKTFFKCIFILIFASDCVPDFNNNDLQRVDVKHNIAELFTYLVVTVIYLLDSL